MPSSQPENHLDNDKSLDSIVNNLILGYSQRLLISNPSNLKIVAKTKSDIEKYTQSKLKAFAGEVEKAIGGGKPDFSKVDDYNRSFLEAMFNAYFKKIEESLKAIKEKAGIE